MPARFKDLCLDAADDRALAEWWCTAMGYALRLTAEDDAAAADAGDPVAGAGAGDAAGTVAGQWTGAIEDPSGVGPLIWINQVPEVKTVKNRMHLDVVGNTRELLALGATLVRTHDAEIRWDVLADPEGNEFCVFAPEN